MYLIVGLGNPGRQYEKTRHNMGFDVVDELVDKHNVPQAGVKFNAMYGKAIIGGEKAILMKPLSFMNLSGGPVRDMINFFKIDPETEMIVISDDIDLDPGQLRIRKQGSAGGHNGIKDIIQQLGTQKFVRVRVGVGAKPKDWDLADHVLGRFVDSDRKLVDEAIKKAAEAVEKILADGVDIAMNEYNRKPPKPKKKKPEAKIAENAGTEAEKQEQQMQNKVVAEAEKQEQLVQNESDAENKMQTVTKQIETE